MYWADDALSGGPFPFPGIVGSITLTDMDLMVRVSAALAAALDLVSARARGVLLPPNSPVACE